MARGGDPDAVYCSAVWNAAAYVDETRSLAERKASRAAAIDYHNKARQLGYDFNRIAMFGMTFEQLIADGDRLNS